ncbi:uncharacterized protein A4U43_C04F32210 [Asparagus officinalis]|uniref:Uncharacterized protein n=1 Tax=Asparagus officinalis TaxID=4686 RepID=A0A5P1F542_ASPOF|nr:uncharacterized protein A4U43_C04F32210 [Asparagus officinalis]
MEAEARRRWEPAANARARGDRQMETLDLEVRDENSRNRRRNLRRTLELEDLNPRRRWEPAANARARGDRQMETLDLEVRDENQGVEGSAANPRARARGWEPTAKMGNRSEVSLILRTEILILSMMVLEWICLEVSLN